MQQLEAKPQYLYMYLDVLFDKDAPSCQPYSDRMVGHSSGGALTLRLTYMRHTTMPD